MDNFITIKNFKHLFKLLNIYSEEKYNVSLNFKNFKKIIGNSMYEINENFGNKLTTKKKNILIIKILKEIIDEKQQVDNFFEIENNDFESSKKQNDNIYNTLNYNNFIEKKEEEKKTEINILEKKLENEKKIYEKIINNNDKKIDNSIKQTQDIEKYLKEIQFEKKEKEKINMEDKIKNLNQEIIISPELYKKTINKYIKIEDLIIDSRDRNHDNYDSNNYIIDLNNEINNVFPIEILEGIFPNSEYIVNNNNNILHVEETLGNIIEVEIPIGNYTKTELAQEIEDALNNSSFLSSTYNVSTENVSVILNKIETNDSNFINYTGNNIEYIFNNNINDYWSTNLATDNPSFFIYDFKKKVLIKEYSFISKNSNRPKDFSLEISNDLINWTTIQNVINQTTTTTRYKTYSFPSNNIFSRYIKFSITNSSGGNLANVSINNMNFITYSNTKIQIESDLVSNEQNYFNLRFFGGNKIYNNKTYPYYLEKSIGELIGFLPEDKLNLGFYSSDNNVIIKNDKLLILDINEINEIRTIIELDSDINNYTYRKQLLNNSIRILDKMEKFKKLKIQFFNRNNQPFYFNGLEHSFIIRFFYYNTNQVFRDSI